MLSGHSDGTLQLHSPDGARLWCRPAHTTPVVCVCVLPGGALAVTSASPPDASLLVWSLAEVDADCPARVLCAPPPFAGHHTCVAPVDARRLAVGYSRGGFAVFNAHSCALDVAAHAHSTSHGSSLQQLQTTQQPCAATTCLAAVPDTHLLLVGCDDGSVSVCDSWDGSTLRRLELACGAQPASPVTCLSAWGDGVGGAVAGHADGRIRLWHLGGDFNEKTCRGAEDLAPHSADHWCAQPHSGGGGVCALLAMRGGRVISTGGAANDVLLWEVAPPPPPPPRPPRASSGSDHVGSEGAAGLAQVRALFRLGGGCAAVAPFGDDHVLVVARDGTLRLWDAWCAAGGGAQAVGGGGCTAAAASQPPQRPPHAPASPLGRGRSLGLWCIAAAGRVCGR